MIDGFDLPGLTFCDPDGHPLNDIRVGVQLGQEPHDLVRGDAMSARWELDVRVVAGSDTSMDFKGPAVSFITAALDAGRPTA